MELARRKQRISGKRDTILSSCSYQKRMQQLEKRFRRGDIMAAWLVIERCIILDIKLPEWAAAYFWECTKNLQLLSNKPKMATREAEAAGKAIGFGGNKDGNKNYFSAKYITRRDHSIFCSLYSGEKSKSELARDYCLSEDFITKIFRKMARRTPSSGADSR